jgi:hypothetical protein
MDLRQKVPHLLANMLRVFNAGFQSSGLHRRRHSTQFGSNFKKCKTSISRNKQPWQTLDRTRDTIYAQRVEDSLQALLKASLLRLSFGLVLVNQFLSLRLVSSKQAASTARPLALVFNKAFLTARSSTWAFSKDLSVAA